MITEKLLNLMFETWALLLDKLPVFSAPQIPADFVSNLKTFVNGVFYFVPQQVVGIIIITFLGWNTFRLGWSIAMRIKSFVPTMGD